MIEIEHINLDEIILRFDMAELDAIIGSFDPAGLDEIIGEIDLAFLDEIGATVNDSEMQRWLDAIAHELVNVALPFEI